MKRSDMTCVLAVLLASACGSSASTSAPSEPQGAPEARATAAQAAQPAAATGSPALQLAAADPASCGGADHRCGSNHDAFGITKPAAAPTEPAAHSCGGTEHSCGASHDLFAEAKTPAAEAAGAAPLGGSALTRITEAEHAGLCMLSNRYLGEHRDVPIEVEGKTYHGCCANCAARLGARPEARTAQDPITGKPVDKASAVLARDKENRVYYFESEATLAQYSAR
ncbi:MAG: hypothetical protein ABW321_02860 [Polyangiales bacterium]